MPTCRFKQTRSESISPRITPTTLDRLRELCEALQGSYADIIERLTLTAYHGVNSLDMALQAKAEQSMEVAPSTGTKSVVWCVPMTPQVREMFEELRESRGLSQPDLFTALVYHTYEEVCGVSSQRE